jgi:hypothetical protein
LWVVVVTAIKVKVRGSRSDGENEESFCDSFIFNEELSILNNLGFKVN